MIRPIHPFPARMAPELAINAIASAPLNGVVLDPMVGSGTVVRQAAESGRVAVGFDLDPLSVLMARAWTTPVNADHVREVANAIIRLARTAPEDGITLPWIDDDKETGEFVEYWFGERQRCDLRRLVFALNSMDVRKAHGEKTPVGDLLKVALSRIIITKDSGASLGRDVSHSRPHKVKEESGFEVLAAFNRSVDRVLHLLRLFPPPGNVTVEVDDSRRLSQVRNRSIDLVLTSPPYLNAIDYMRGHRLSLVWLGFRVSELRAIRAQSVGAERGLCDPRDALLFQEIRDVMGELNELPRRRSGMIDRYIEDIYRIMSQAARVLKPEGRVVLVVGDSCVSGTFIRNSDGFVKAAEMVGLRLLDRIERELPNGNRYLPMSAVTGNPLAKRMRTENVLTFAF